MLVYLLYSQTEGNNMATIEEWEIPKNVIGFAHGWMYAFMEYGKDNHYEDYDEWCGCGDWDLNLVVGNWKARIIAYRFVKGELQTQDWAEISSKPLPSML